MLIIVPVVELVESDIRTRVREDMKDAWNRRHGENYGRTRTAFTNHGSWKDHGPLLLISIGAVGNQRRTG